MGFFSDLFKESTNYINELMALTHVNVAMGQMDGNLDADETAAMAKVITGLPTTNNINNYESLIKNAMNLKLASFRHFKGNAP